MQFVSLSTNTIQPDTGSTLNTNSGALKLTGALWVDDIIPLSQTNTIQITGQKLILGTAAITQTIEATTIQK